MISIVRLDERLIHGQIGIAWAGRMGTEILIVCNDKAANNPLSKSTLLAAAPRNNKTVVKTVEQTLKLLRDPRGANKKIFVIVGNWDDLYTIATEVEGVDYINIGNYGRMAAGNPNRPRKRYGTDIFLNEEELEKALKVAALPVRVEQQTIPENASIPLKELLKKGE